VKAGSRHFKFSQSVANCLLRNSNDNFFQVQTLLGFRSAHILLHENMRNNCGHRKKMHKSVIGTGNEMPIGNFMWLWTGNKCVKNYFKILSSWWENGKLNATHCIVCNMTMWVKLITMLNSQKHLLTRLT